MKLECMSALYIFYWGTWDVLKASNHFVFLVYFIYRALLYENNLKGVFMEKV